jgi:hypothetical protein
MFDESSPQAEALSRLTPGDRARVEALLAKQDALNLWYYDHRRPDSPGCTLTPRCQVPLGGHAGGADAIMALHGVERLTDSEEGKMRSFAAVVERVARERLAVVAADVVRETAVIHAAAHAADPIGAVNHDTTLHGPGARGHGLHLHEPARNGSAAAEDTGVRLSPSEYRRRRVEKAAGID